MRRLFRGRKSAPDPTSVNQSEWGGCATLNADDYKLWIALKTDRARTDDEVQGFSLAEVIEAGLRVKIVGLAEADRDAAIADCIDDTLYQIKTLVSGEANERLEELCRLPASGFTETPESVLVWADQVVAMAKKKLNGFVPRVWLWAYRNAGTEYLAADIGDEHESSVGHSLTFVIGAGSRLNIDEPFVPDMTDALHLVGIVAEGLRADVEVGRRGNEVNEAVLARPLALGETNGKMRTAGSVVLPPVSNSPATAQVSQPVPTTRDSEIDFLTSYVVADVTNSAGLGYLAGGSLPGAILGADAAETRTEHRAEMAAPSDVSTGVDTDCAAPRSIDTGRNIVDATPSSADGSWVCDSSSSLGSGSDSTSSSSSSGCGYSSDSGASSFDSGSGSGTSDC